MIGKSLILMSRALILYFLMSWPAFVLGIYLGNLRFFRKQSVKRYLIASWVLVITGFCILVGGYFLGKSTPGIRNIGVMAVLGAFTAAGAIPAGAALSKQERKTWEVFLPPAFGIVSQAVLYGSTWLAEQSPW